MALLVLHWDLVGQYWIVTLLIMGSLFAGLLAFLWALLGKWRLALLLTLPILATAIVALPKPGETLFWLAGWGRDLWSKRRVVHGMDGRPCGDAAPHRAGFLGVVLCILRFAWRSVGWFSRA